MASNDNLKQGDGKALAGFGPYFLQLEFKKNRTAKKVEPLNLEPQHIHDFTITLDASRFLPAFHLEIDDAIGILTHIMPHDQNMSKFHVQLGASTAPTIDQTTLFSFDVYRRFPTSDFTYEITGLLGAKNLFSPGQTRSFTGTIKSTIESIAMEIGMDRSEVSTSLDYEKTIIQPGWSNAKLLNWLKTNVIGKSKEANYYCFVKCVNNENVLVFKPVKDFIKSKPKYRFTFIPEVEQDKTSKEVFWPILQYKFIDNYKIMGVAGTKKQEVEYYDMATSQYKHESFLIDNNDNALYDYYSFTERHAIDDNDLAGENITLAGTGRNNGFTVNFEGRAMNGFHQDITDLCKLWIDVWGIEDIYPGDIIETMYLESPPPDSVSAYSHEGFWMVERVVHIIKEGFFTRLLLTRNGYEAGVNCNLMVAKTRKKR